MNKKQNSDIFSFKLSDIVVWFPLINITVLFIIGMFGKDNTTVQYARAIIYFLVIFFVIRFYGTETVSRTIIFFLAYLFCLLPAASEFLTSFNIYLKVLITMLMYPVGYFLINTREKIVHFLKYFVIASFLLNMNYIYAQIFNVGRSVYLEDTFYYGYAGIGSPTMLSYFLLITPLIVDEYKNFRERWFLRVNVFIGILFTFLAMKRISILALVGGFLIFIFFTKQLKKYLKILIILSLALIITSPFYLDTLIERYEARRQKIFNPTEEGRYYDIVNALKLLETEGVKHFLFGSEPFNTPKLFGTYRQVHVDYANILITTGTIGLFLYLLIYWLIALKFFRLFKCFQIKKFESGKKYFLQNLKGSFFAVLIASLIISISGGLHAVGDRAVLFLLLGSFTGFLHRALVTNNRNMVS